MLPRCCDYVVVSTTGVFVMRVETLLLPDNPNIILSKEGKLATTMMIWKTVPSTDWRSL